MTLFQLDSPEDLVARGVSRELIMEKIGVDVGHNGCNYIRVLRGIDRTEYQRQHIQERTDPVEFQALLDRYALGEVDKADFCRACGVNVQCRLNLKSICEAAGFGDQYLEARKQQYGVRSARTKQSLLSRYGVTSSLHVPGARERYEKTMIKRYGVAHALQSDELKEKAKATTKEHFGVEHCMQSAELRDKAKATMLEKYGCEYATQNPEVYAKVLATTKERYGVEHPMQSADCMAKAQATNLKKYGCKNVFQSDDFKKKAVATMLARYGVTVPARSLDIKARTIETNRVRYGCDYPMQNADVRGRADDTCVSRYGVPFRYMLRSPEMADRVKQTCLDRYGVESPFLSEEIREKSCQTREARYGGRYTLQSEQLVSRIRETVRNKYGVDYTGQIPEAHEKARQTCLERYGVEYGTQNPDVLAKVRATMMARYGVPYSMLNPSLVEKMLATKDAHGTHNGSASEDVVYDKLVGVFGASDVVRQYRSDAYPYFCDFYIPSRNMYIECNGYISHWRHWFGSDESDSDTLADLREKLSPAFYDKLEKVWRGADVAKRETARKNNLNYVVFWGDNSEDADIWFALGCPDGRDWEREYSWLPERELIYDGDWPSELLLTERSILSAVRMAQWVEFYKSAIMLWNQRFDYKWGTIQARLFTNRLKHIGKGPNELTNFEIMRGLHISGMVRGYSHFSLDGLFEFLERYNIKSVYDPCSGWGERMLAFSKSGVDYLGVDINEHLFDGYVSLVEQYGLDNVSFMIGDSSKIDLSHAHHDCVFTCPPYEGLEIYTEIGAENLDHGAFIKWWTKVIEHSVGSDTKIFAYQIDQNHKDAMNQVLLDKGWHLDSQIPVGVNKVNHMSRAKGSVSKKNFEEIQVFVR